jgi:hypothetical protein
MPGIGGTRSRGRSGLFAGIFRAAPSPASCLPCRRSWVRIPSAALEKACICRSFSYVQSAGAFASPGSHWVAAGQPAARGVTKRLVCRPFVGTRTRDLLRPQTTPWRLSATAFAHEQSRWAHPVDTPARRPTQERAPAPRRRVLPRRSDTLAADRREDSPHGVEGVCELGRGAVPPLSAWHMTERLCSGLPERLLLRRASEGDARILARLLLAATSLSGPVGAAYVRACWAPSFHAGR